MRVWKAVYSDGVARDRQDTETTRLAGRWLDARWPARGGFGEFGVESGGIYTASGT